jgi:hypothetical protein
VEAADAVWAGGAGNWTDNLWTVTPTEQTDVKIDGGKTDTSSTVTANLFSDIGHNLLIDAGDSLVIPGAGRVSISGDATVNGSLQIADASMPGHGGGEIVFKDTGDAVLGGTGSIFIGGDGVTGQSGILNNNSGVLTFGPDILIHGSGIIHTLSTFVNMGTISADVSGGTLDLHYVTNKGIFKVTQGAQLNALAGDNLGLIQVSGGVASLGSLASGVETFSNNFGTIEITSGGELKLQRGYNAPSGLISVDGGTLTMLLAQWKNQGTITLHDFVFNIKDSISTPDLGTIAHSGTGITNLSSVLTNIGATLALSGTADNWLIKAGTITGGVVTADNGAKLMSMDGALDGVSLSTSIALVPSTFAGDTGDRSLTVRNSLALNGASIELAADANHGATLLFTGPAVQTLSGNGEILFGPLGTNSITIKNEMHFLPLGGPITIQAGDVTIGPDFLVHGAFGNIGVGSDAHFTNQGLISADIAGGVLTIANLTNNGRIEAKSGSTINLGQGFTQPTGKLEADGTVASTIAVSLGGITTGIGTIAATTRIEGTLSPGIGDGQQPGILSIIGDLSFAPSSHLIVQVGSDADLVKLTGSIDLSGADDSIDLSQIGPVQAGTSFVIATYTGSLSGSFDHVTAGYDVSYATPHEIVVTAVPEPSSCVIAALGILLRCRRTRASDRTLELR